MPWQKSRDEEGFDEDFDMLAAASQYHATGGGLGLAQTSSFPTQPGIEHALSHIDGPDPAPEELYWYALEQATQDPHPPTSDRPPAELAAMHLVSEAEERAEWRNGPSATARSCVSEVMTHEVVSVSPSAPASEVRDVFAHFALHHVPVVEDERVVGILSSSDLLRLDPVSTSNRRLRARHLMRTPAVTVRDDASVQRAAQLLCEGALHALPVVDEQRRLIGIVTSTDLIRVLCNLRA